MSLQGWARLTRTSARVAGNLRKNSVSHSHYWLHTRGLRCWAQRPVWGSKGRRVHGRAEPRKAHRRPEPWDQSPLARHPSARGGICSGLAGLSVPPARPKYLWVRWLPRPHPHTHIHLSHFPPPSSKMITSTHADMVTLFPKPNLVSPLPDLSQQQCRESCHLLVLPVY